MKISTLSEILELYNPDVKITLQNLEDLDKDVIMTTDIFNNKVSELDRDDLFQIIGSCASKKFYLLTIQDQQTIENMVTPASTVDVPIPYLGGGDYLPNMFIVHVNL